MPASLAAPVRRPAAPVLVLGLALGLAPVGCVRDNPAFGLGEGDAASDSDSDADTDADTDADGDGAAAAGATIAAVTYDLTWSWGQAEPLPQGGWATVNDLGYRIEVTRGHLVSTSAALSPCTSASASAGEAAPASLPERLLSALAAPSRALAGHSGVADPSQIEAPQVEDLAAPVDLRLGEATFEGAAYCWIHYLAARASEATAGLPADLEMDGVTLYLEGTYARADEEGSAEAFTAQVGAASGVLVDLEGALTGGEGARARVVVTRELGRAFDGADLATLDPEALGRVVLENLVAGAAVAVTLEGEAAAPE